MYFTICSIERGAFIAKSSGIELRSECYFVKYIDIVSKRNDFLIFIVKCKH